MTGKISNIQAVTFDLWETLLYNKKGDDNKRRATRCLRTSEAFGKLGMPVSVEKVELAFAQVASRLVTIWETDEDVSHIEQLELLVKFVSDGSLSLKNEWVEELSSAYIKPFFEFPPHLNPCALKVLEELEELGKRIGLICNTGLTPGFALRKFLDSEGALDFFDFLFFSDEVGLRKPDPRVFQHTARKLKVAPYQVVHVGDNLRLDVWGAQRAGFKAILFDSREGKDEEAEADPNSLVALSRRLGPLEKTKIVPDKVISSFDILMDAVKEIDLNMRHD